MSTVLVAPEMSGLKAKLKATWMSGDYDRFSRYMEADACAFYKRLNIPAGWRLLDVACGSGQVALCAARDGLNVTGVDIAPNLVERARSRAAEEGLHARFVEGDAEELPFEDASFDVVVSLVGAMFAPRPELVAEELLRVCCPGGTIAMGNWTPQGFIGQMFKTFSKFIAPSGMPAPVLWGDENVARERLEHGVAEFHFAQRLYRFAYPFPPAEVVEFFRKFYGPTNRAFAALGAREAQTFRKDLVELWTANNCAVDGTTEVLAEYLEVVAMRG
jgi:SAM-dependent methyltransferase